MDTDASRVSQPEPALESAEGLFRTYPVHRLTDARSIDADWDKPAWRTAETGQIALAMGPLPKHPPRAQFRILYDEHHLYLIFRVEDRCVRAIQTRDEGRVWEDSCVEFFFTPGAEAGPAYFNFETNCVGARYWHYHPDAHQERALAPADLAQVAMAHSLSGPIDPEVREALTWTVEYRFPVAMLGHYTAVTPPAPGAVWRANLYKCADKTSVPHFLTWSRVEHPTPKFHLPPFFGTLRFMA